LSAPHSIADYTGEVESTLKGPHHSPRDYGTSGCSGARLFAKVNEKSRKLRLGKGVDEVCGGCGSIGAKAHVQRAVMEQTKSTGAVVQLRAADAKVGEYTINTSRKV
jgi:hypothetical protein